MRCRPWSRLAQGGAGVAQCIWRAALWSVGAFVTVHLGTWRVPSASPSSNFLDLGSYPQADFPPREGVFSRVPEIHDAEPTLVDHFVFLFPKKTLKGQQQGNESVPLHTAVNGACRFFLSWRPLSSVSQKGHRNVIFVGKCQIGRGMYLRSFLLSI